MIDVNTFGVAITAVLTLIILIFFLFSESRQHSPAYYPSLHRMYDIKITPILLHAFNFANVLVLGLQLVIMPQVVDRSDYVKSDVFIFAKKLREIEYTLKDFEEYSKNVTELDQYQNSLLSIGSSKTDGRSLLKFKDTIIADLEVNLENLLPTKKQLQEKNKNYRKRLELDRYVYLSKHLDSIVNKSFETTEKLYDIPKNALDSIQLIIEKGRNVDDLRFQLTHFYRVIQQDSILKELSTYQPDTAKIMLACSAKDSIIFNKFKEKYKLTYEPKNVIMIKPLKRDCFSKNLNHKILLYPNLMMVQVCISLLLGIVGQLIISDKTVTEAL